MVNKENMEKWIAALEAYDRKPARGALNDYQGNMCAVGIGLNTMMPGCLGRNIRGALAQWPEWLGVSIEDGSDVALKVDGSGSYTVIMANDRYNQSPWTIAQRLRATYLKDEE